MLKCHPQDKDIGQEHALFYVAHASFLEIRGAHSRAEAAYKQGLERWACTGFPLN